MTAPFLNSFGAYARSAVAGMVSGSGSRGAAAQTFAARGLVLVLNVATGILVTRLLGPEGRGEQAALGVGVFFFAGLLSLGLPSSVTYNLSRDAEARPRLLGASLTLGVGLGVAATLVGVIALPFWLSQFSAEVQRSAQLLMATCVVSLLIGVCSSALEALGDFTTSNLSRLLNPALTLSGLVVLAATDALTPLSGALCYIGAGAPTLVWLLARLWRLCPPQLAMFRESSERLVRFASRAAGIDILNTLATQFDQILVVGLLQPAQAGAYYAALSAARVLNVVQMSIVTVLFPKAASRSPEEALMWIGLAARLTLASTSALAAPLIFLGPWLIELLYGPAFLPAVPLFRILVVDVVVSSLAIVLAQGFMALGRPGWVAALQALGLALTAPLIVILAPTYGLTGVGLSLLASAIFRLAFVLAAYPLVLKVRPPRLLLSMSDIRFSIRS